jgi:hypothetical protein
VSDAQIDKHEAAQNLDAALLSRIDGGTEAAREVTIEASLRARS